MAAERFDDLNALHRQIRDAARRRPRGPSRAWRVGWVLSWTFLWPLTLCWALGWALVATWKAPPPSAGPGLRAYRPEDGG